MSVFKSNPVNLAFCCCVLIRNLKNLHFWKITYYPAPCANPCERSLLLTDALLKSSETAKLQPAGNLRSTPAVISRWLHSYFVPTLLASQRLHVWNDDVYRCTCFCQKMYRALYDKFWHMVELKEEVRERVWGEKRGKEKSRTEKERSKKMQQEEFMSV